MSDSSDGDRGRLCCLSCILHKCIGVQNQKIKDLAVNLLGGKIIDRETKKTLVRLVEQDRQHEALDRMIKAIEDQKQVDKIPDFLEDCDVSENVVNLAHLAIQGRGQLFIDLVTDWEVLVERQEELKREAEIVWPDRGELGKDWPINFLQFCGSQATHEKLRCFLETTGLAQPARTDVDDEGLAATKPTHRTDFGEPSRRTMDTDETDQGFVLLSDTVDPEHAKDGGNSEKMEVDVTVSPGVPGVGQSDFSDLVGKEPTQGVQPMEVDQQIQPYDPKNYQEAPEEQKASQYGEDIGAEFFAENRDVITASRDILLPVVELLWPENKELTNHDNWPRQFMQVVHDSDNEVLLRHLANVFKYLLDIKEEFPDIKLASPIEHAQIEEWILNNAFILNQAENEIFKMLFAIAWQEIEKNRPASMVDNLLKLSETPDAKLGIFLSLAEMIMSTLSRVPTTAKKMMKERSSSEETVESTSSDSNSNPERNSDKAFFVDKLDEIEAAREILAPVVQLMWPGKNILTDRENWQGEFMQAVSDTDNETALRHLVNVFKYMLDTKKEFPDIQPAAPLEHAELEEWISNDATNLTQTGDEIFTTLFAIAWPEFEKNPPGSLFESLLDLSKTEDAKLGIFVSLSTMIMSKLSPVLIKPRYGLQNVEETMKERSESEATEEPTSPDPTNNPEHDFDRAFFAENDDVIRASREILAPAVQLMWPGEETPTNKEEWPWNLLSAVANSENVALIHQLAKICRWLLRMKKNNPEMIPPTRMNSSEATAWIRRTVPRFKDSEQTSDIYKTLLSGTWPGIETIKPETWEDHLLDMLSTDETLAIDFMTVAAMTLTTDEAFAPGVHELREKILEDSKSEKELFARKIAGHRAILLPVVKLAWPARNELTAEDGWPRHLIGVISSWENTSLVKRFKDTCEWFLRMKQIAPEFEPTERMTQIQTREWIILAPAEIRKSEERVNALSSLFEMSWPERIPDPGEWTKFLLRQYKQDMGKAASFVDAARMALQLCDASAREGTIQKLDLHGLNDDIKIVNENYDMMISDRDILAPFVRLTWPDKVELLDEKYWPSDMLARFANSEDILRCHEFAEVLRNITPMRNAAPDFRANSSFDSYEARGWMMRATRKLGESDEEIAYFEQLYRIAWPRTERLPPKGTWTYTLLRNYKTDESRATYFANAAELLSNLSRASTGKDQQPTEEFDSRVEFFNSKYDEIEVSGDILKNISVLAWPHETKLTDDKTWPEVLIAKATSSKRTTVPACFVNICRNVLEIQKHASNYTPIPLKRDKVKRWLMIGASELIRKKRELFSDLLEITWPNRRPEQAKWTGFIFERYADDEDKAIEFAKVGESILQLIKACQEAKKSRERKDVVASASQQPKTGISKQQQTESARTQASAHAMQTRSQVSSADSAPPEIAPKIKARRPPNSAPNISPRITDVDTGEQSRVYGRGIQLAKEESASSGIAHENEAKQQLISAHNRPVRRIDVLPSTGEQSQIASPDIQTIIGRNPALGNSIPDSSQSMLDSRADTFLRQNYERKQPEMAHTDALSTPLTGVRTNESHEMTLRRWQQQFIGEWLIVRVAVFGIRPGECICINYQNCCYKLYQLGNSVFSGTLPWAESLAYWYTVHNERDGTWRGDASPGVLNRVVEPRGRLYIFDVAYFGNTRKPLLSVWSELMLNHFPLHNGELLQSELLHPEIAGLLEQIQCGWKVVNQSQEERTVKADQRTIASQVLIPWLQSLQHQERVLASIAIALVINRRKYDADEVLLKEISTGMRVSSMTTDERSQLYHKICSVFSTETSAIQSSIITVMRSVCGVDVTWILAIPLFFVMKYNDIVPFSRDQHMNKKMPLLSVKESFLKDIPVNWDAIVYEEKSYQENLIKLAPDLTEMVETYPWMALPYQQLLEGKYIARLVANDCEIVKAFELDCFLKKMLNHFDNLHKSGKDLKSLLDATRKHFEEMFKHARIIIGHFSQDDMTSSVLMMNVTLASIIDSLQRDIGQNKKHVHFCVQLSALLSDWVFTLCRTAQRVRDETTLDLLGKILNLLLRQIRVSELGKSSEIEFWDKVIGENWHENFKSHWVQAIQSEIGLRIEKIWTKHDDFLTFYMNQDISEALEMCFEEKAVKCAECLLTAETSKESATKMRIRKFKSALMGKSAKISFFEKLFLARSQKHEISERESDIKKILRFVCDWPIATEFFRKFNNKESRQQLKKVKPIIDNIENICKDFVHSLASEQVGAADLHSISEDQVPKVCEFLEPFAEETISSTAHGLQRMILDLIEKKNTFYKEYNRFTMFFNMCKTIEGVEMEKCEKIKSIYEVAHVSKLLCNFFTRDDVAADPDRFYGLRKEDMEEFALMDIVKRSSVFGIMWMEIVANHSNAYNTPSGSLVKIAVVDWKVVLREIWMTVKAELCSLVEEISQGSLKLSSAIHRFSFTNGKIKSIHDELTKLSKFYRAAASVVSKNTLEDESIVQAAMSIHNVFEIEQDHQRLKWFREYKRKFNLRGDFKSIEDVMNFEDKGSTLCDITGDALKHFPQELREISHDRLKVLQTFSNQNELISWLLESKMKDAAEVKSMCDLAIASAGETPIETDRWMCLDSAVQGFSPLLFELENVNCLDELLMRCQEVWSSVEEGNKIMKKWNDTGDQLQWFREKQSLYGSDQKLSLRYAQDINERGVYTVGRQIEEQPTLGNAISLALRPGEVSPHRKGQNRKEKDPEIFKLHHLQDLQSKLALIARKDKEGQQDIAQFEDIFSAVKTLGESFINLVDAGCMLFNDWTAVIASAPYKTADKQNEHNLTLTIRFIKKSTPLSGSASLSLLNELSKTLRQVYCQWTEYISSKRLQHYYLNEYSIQQITYLCHQLANLTLLPDQVFALLSKDPKRLAPAVIQDALDQAIRIEDPQEPQDGGEENQGGKGAMSELEKKKRTIRLLVNRERLPEDLAKAAVQAVGHEDYDECSSWALLHEYDKDLVEEKLQAYNEENAYAHEKNEEEELVDVLHNRAVNSLTEMIDQILKTTQSGDSVKLVGAVKTICTRYYERTSVLTVQDYLSIDHLGKMLTNLYAGTEVNPRVDREMPDPLEQGKSNLIVCSEGETLPILLSLYMNSPKEPLPTTSEVLLCSENTTVDDVERFMRRAMCKCNHNEKPLFCMGYSEKLNFNVSRALENFFEYMSHQDRYIDQDYQLVFISSSQQHYMTECFDKYQVQRWTKHSTLEISQYLNEHLASSEVTTNSEFGASIVRVVASNRSGVGKSLFIKNLSAALDIKWYQSSNLDHVNALANLLGRDEDVPQLPGRVMPRQLRPGKPNLIHCPEGEILRVLMALYMHNPEDPRPTSSEILLCCQQTTEQEVERFLRRAMRKLDKENSVFTIAFGERLTPSCVRQIKSLSETLANNMHGRSDYQLVILSSHLSQFSWCEKFELAEGSNLGSSQNILAYLSGGNIQGSTDIVVQEIVQGDEEDSKKKMDSFAVPEPTQVWHKTTVRLLEKVIDTNHVLDKLCRETHFSNGDNHFIHIDLTPAVEDGIERFMFNLLILGTIQDDSGRVWNRQKQHLYIIEMTESVLNQDQVAKSSILGVLPRTYCKSPKESLEKLRTVRQRVKEALEPHLPSFPRGEAPALRALQNYINGSTKFSLENFRYNEKNCKEHKGLSEILYLAGIPSSVIPSIGQGITEELRETLLEIYDEELTSMVLMNHSQFISTNFQRPYQYLKYYRGKEEADPLTRKDLNLDDFQYSQPAGTPEDCIHTILQTGALGMNPSWAQVRHFTTFMNMQLQNCEESQFCQKISTLQNEVFGWQDTELRGLKAFAVKFMMRMSQDFATPSLDIADQSSKDADAEAIATHQVRSRWEEKCHPYVFFNEDRSTMTFINVALNSRGDLLDEDGKILERNIASPSLMQGLRAQGIKFGFNFHLLSRKKKLGYLRTVMGLKYSEEDPDPTYELTTDNVLKILAIYMRMRCNIPVVIMGETGCGKTRLVEFMSRLRSQGVSDVQNMVTLKIHGGVTARDIYKSVEKANQLAAENATRNIGTVLFYDEANTTTGIYAIKEVVCDGTVNGKSFHGSHLQIVAACNPYKELSEKAIKILEKSGLGYRVSEEETSKSLGIPMRRLVYKVVALPPGIQPFVWDFGELSIEAEEKYIRQMTGHLQRSLGLSTNEKELTDFVFCAAQSYMKTEMKDECRYVSLRDIERCMKFFAFFHGHQEYLFEKIQNLLNDEYAECDAQPPPVSSTLRCLIQTIGVCYHASLHERKKFREHITQLFRLRDINMTERDMSKELIACQNIFLDSIKMEKDIAPNEALRENVYLITICTQLGIPLFLVGKPGSSKSLARTIVAANMSGKNSHSPLYRRLKQIQMVTYQCSALTDAKGIESIFKQCAKVQENRNLKEFAAVVVLDEIGLAEDSPNMPLKILHPLLECGSTTSGTLAKTNPDKKVGFVGISNWALDPAKMNRGIFVTRSTPSKADLLETAKGIMKTKFRLMNEETEILRRLTEIYLEIYNSQIQTLSKEYFGLRDYYALIKMVNSSSANKGTCDMEDVAYAAQRNFGGGRQSYFTSFTTAVESQFVEGTAKQESVQNMIRQNLEEQDTRFLLLLTTQHASVSLLEHVIGNFSEKVQVIYGSSFPGDHNFTEICKNINRIKVCMETGGIVVLLDMVEIHESLYDALNQHYTTYGGQRYVDIGLGGNRFPCRIADDFRLIVVEQKDVVYLEYPIPLINRLEKHHLISESLLSDSQKELASMLTKWAKNFSKCNVGPFAEKDAFVGYHADTTSSLVLSQRSNGSLETCKNILLQTAAADAMLRASNNPLLAEKENLLQRYTEEQVHDSLVNLLQYRIKKYRERLSLMEITSFSNILTEKDRKKIGNSLQLQPNSIMLLSLQQFDTQQEYLAKLDTFFTDSKELSREDVKVLLIQCPQAEKHGSLLACAKYCVTNRLKDAISKGTVIIAFLLSTQRQHGNEGDAKHQLILQHGVTTEIIYVDDMRPTGAGNTVVSQFYNKSLTEILRIGGKELEETRAIGEDTINFMGLLKDSICQAMAKIRRGNRTDYRNLKCIQLLTKLCSQEEGLGHEFRSILVEKMIDIYSDREKDVGRVVSSWIIREANSAENLQEGGTFGKTLCLCLKRHLADLLSFIVSEVDENNNLDFFLAETDRSWKQDIWLMLFAAHKMEWSRMNGLQEFQVQILPHLPHDYTPQLPFSSVLNSVFEVQWDIIQNEEEAVKVFFNQFREMSQYQILQSLCTNDNMDDAVKSYAADVIHCLFDFSKLGEVGQEWLTKILLAIADKKKEKLMQEEIYQNGDDLTIVYYSYKQHFKHLSMLHDIFRVCPDLLLQVNEWIDEQAKERELIILELAMKSMLDWIKAYDIKDKKSCVDWMVLTSECKAIFHSCRDLIQMAKHKKEIATKWEPISLLDLLLLQLLPSAGSDSFRNYIEVVVNHAKRLLNQLKRYGFRNKDFLRMILNVLRRSYEDIRLRLLIRWGDPTCGMCRRALENPVKLPCGHFVCSGCIDRILAAAEMRRQCPRCPTQVPNDIDTSTASLSEQQEGEAADFKANCTSFFLQYLKKFCFSNRDSEMEEQAKLFLYELVAAVSKNGGKMELETLAIDLNIATRSNIFQLLLDNYPDLVKVEIDKLLSSRYLSYKQLQELIIIILHGYETNLHEPQNWQILKENWRYLKNQTGGVNLEALRVTAAIRHTLLEQLPDIRGGTELNPNQLAVIEMCAFDDTGTLGTFMVKAGCQLFGLEWFNFISNHRRLKDLVPRYLRDAANDKTVDHWLILGPKYAEIREKIHKISYDNYRQQLQMWITENQEMQDKLPIILAITWHGKANHVYDLRQRLGGANPLLRIFNLLNKEIPTFSRNQSDLLNQLIILTGCVLMCQPALMGSYYHLATNPAGVSELFWPAMPESLFFSIRDILASETRIATYACPNGHPYVIGECTRPWIEAECPECGEIIGGRLHQAAEGNQRIEQSEASQAGYQLLADIKGKDDPCDRMSKQGVAVAHFITHCCMLIALEQDPVTIYSFLGVNGEDKEAAKNNLYAKLQKNIADLSQALGRNYDDAVIVLHSCIVSLIANGFKVDHQNADSNASTDNEPTWETMRGRRNWEKRFRGRYLLPVFKNLDKVLNDARNQINAVEKLHDMLLYKTVHEIEIDEERTEITWKHPNLWKIIMHSKAAHLLQSVRDSQAKGRVLNVILESPDLHLLQHLENVLKLQKALITKYQNQIDMKQVDEITFDMYMDGGEGHRNRKLIKDYIYLWNSIYEVFRQETNKKVWPFLQELSLSSPISMALPSARGRGRCAKMLTEYLIDIHNNFLQKCAEAMNSIAGPGVDVQQLLQANFICIDKQNDLLPLISMHTAYNTSTDDSGRHHHIAYNVEALEKQVRENFVVYKSSINKKSLPCITYPQDIGIGSDWGRIMENIKQEPLTNKIVQELDALVTNQDVTPADVCDGVRTVTHAISFLAKIKTEKTKTLHTYLEESLLLTPNHMAMIPRSALVVHTLALYQRLMWHKAVNFVEQGLDPYQEALSKVDQEKISTPDILQRLKDAFDHMDMDLFQQRLNEIIIQAPDHSPGWSLKDEIFPYLEFLDGDDQEWFERIPSEICFKHISHLFQLAVKGINTPNTDERPAQ